MDGAYTSSDDCSTNRAEAERLLGISENLLQNRDLTGAREFAVLAQETEPLLDGSDQILAIADVLIAAGNFENKNHADWYSILQVERRSDDSDLIKKNYRRLALLLHPDKNKFHLADSAFKLVADAWATLSDPTKKSKYDGELAMFTRVDLAPKSSGQSHHQYENNKVPVRRSRRSSAGTGASPSPGVQGNSSTGGGGINTRNSSRVAAFWTACPYCYILYEYPKTYEDCCLRCQSCQKAFHAAALPSLPPRVLGKEAYYCCWGFFPLGFKFGEARAEGISNVNNNDVNGCNNPIAGFPNWMPPIFSGRPAADDAIAASTAVAARDGSGSPGVEAAEAEGGMAAATAGMASVQASVSRKRGRPRKNPL